MRIRSFSIIQSFVLVHKLVISEMRLESELSPSRLRALGFDDLALVGDKGPQGIKMPIVSKDFFVSLESSFLIKVDLSAT